MMKSKSISEQINEKLGFARPGIEAKSPKSEEVSSAGLAANSLVARAKILAQEAPGRRANTGKQLTMFSTTKQ